MDSGKQKQKQQPQQQESRRRRGLAYVTRNACAECQRKKAKCDGKEPCSRCFAIDSTLCRYEISTRASKESLRADIAELQGYRKLSEHLFDVLASGEDDGYVLKELRKGRSAEDISHDLKRYSQALDSPISALASSLPEDDSPSKDDSQVKTASSSHNEINPATDHDIQHKKAWTQVTSDAALIEHLMSLYFCWEYPIFASLSQSHFLADFRSGKENYCSSLLVNSILAVGYHFAGQSAQNIDSKIPERNEFSREARRELEVEGDNPSLTTIQSLTILSLSEASQGGSEQSTFYCGLAIRMAVEMGLHLDNHVEQFSVVEREVRRTTAWAAFSLDHAWCLILGRIPHLSRRGFHAIKPTLFEYEERADWIPYFGPEEQPDNALQQTRSASSVYTALCELFDVIHNSLYILYIPGSTLQSSDILNVYTQYLLWHSSLPAAVRQGENSTPPVFFIHMYYHFSILLLFGPLIKVRILRSGLVPAELCTQAANAISSLLTSFDQLYGLQRAPCFVPIIALASNIMHAVKGNFENVPNPQLSFGMSMLQRMTSSHGFAIHALRIIGLLDQHSGHFGPPSQEDRIMTKFFHRARYSISFVRTDIENILPGQVDPLLLSIFVPFPNQLLPLAIHEEELRALGFELVFE